MRIARTLVALATAGIVALGGIVAPGAPPAAAATTDHDLVFLVDGSGSIDATDWTIQLQGFAAALQDRVNFPLDGSMSVSVVQWSDRARVEVPLTNLNSKAALDGVVATVSAMRQISGGTNSRDGLRAGVNELEANGRLGARRTLCMSTDDERIGGESLTSATHYAKWVDVDKYTVVAIEDGSFNAASATRAYGPYVFGGGTVTTARTTAEFTSLISGCAADSLKLEALEVTRLLKRADEPTEGAHVLTVTVTDSGGAKTSRSVTIHVKSVEEIPAEPSTCSVSYHIQGTWPGAYGAHVTIVNTGPVAIDGWKLEWKPADGEAVTRGWDADIVTAPSGATATDMSWNRTIAPGGPVRFGFNGSIVGTGPPVVPSSFLLNGATCL